MMLFTFEQSSSGAKVKRRSWVRRVIFQVLPGKIRRGSVMFSLAVWVREGKDQDSGQAEWRLEAA